MAAPKLRTLRVPIFIHAPPEQVFQWVSEPERLTRWLSDTATLSPRKGTRYSLGWEGGPAHSGKVLECVPGRSVTLTWQWPGQEELGVTRLKLSVHAKGKGTVLRFTHSGFRGTGPWIALYEGSIRGWTYFLMNLKSVVETGHDLRSPYDW
jgi:uncharacterized protein YndB with AHSA1/START domain